MHYSNDSFKLLPEVPQLLHVLLGLGMELDHLLPTGHASVLIVSLHCRVDTRLEGQQLKHTREIYVIGPCTSTKLMLVNGRYEMFKNGMMLYHKTWHD